MSPSRPKVRYLAICQAGILAAAFCGIDLSEVLNTDAELNLEKKEKKDSVSSRETVSLSNTPIYNRKMHPNGTRSSMDIYGTYRRRRDEDTYNSRPQLDDLAASEIPHGGPGNIHYNESYSEQDTIHFRDEMYPPPITNAAVARFRRESTEKQIDYQYSKSSSPIRRASPSDPFDAKPQRPKTLDVTPEHIVQGQSNASSSAYRFNVSNVPNFSKSTTALSNHAFANSNTSSSSQSPASTPSPKLINKSQTLIDADRVDKVKTMPGRIHPPSQFTQTNSGGGGSSTRPRVQNAFNQPGVKPTTATKQSDFIAFI